MEYFYPPTTSLLVAFSKEENYLMLYNMSTLLLDIHQYTIRLKLDFDIGL